MKNLNSSKDLDTVVTVAVVELLMSPEFSLEWLNELADGMDLSDDQVVYLDYAVIRVLDQLAIPFVNSLPEDLRADYEAALRLRAGDESVSETV